MPSIDKMNRKYARQLAAQGQLIDGCFAVFAKQVYAGAPPEQLRELRVAFFAGAAEVYALLMGAMDDGLEETDGDMRFMQQWTDELERFHAATAARAMETKGNA